MKSTIREQIFAAIDVGTNSIHMTVTKVSPGPDEDHPVFTPLDLMKEQVRLGAQIDENGCLTSVALDKTCQTLKAMGALALKHNAILRAVGTSAMREAKNNLDFTSKILKKTNIDVEIISGHEEARLAYLGVIQALPDLQEKSLLVVDIGGGSTEVFMSERGEERFATSMKLGCVRLNELYNRNPILSDKNLFDLEAHIQARISLPLSEAQRLSHEVAVGTSGTIKSIKAIALALKQLPIPASLHGEILTSEEITLVKNALLEKRDIKDRQTLPGLDSKRTDIIIPGVCLLDAITKMLNISSWIVSLGAIREGIVMDTLQRENHWLSGDTRDVRWRSARTFGEKLKIDSSHAFHVSGLALKLFDATKAEHQLTAPWKEYLRCASYLHEAGLFLGYSSYHKHGCYLIANSDLHGFTEREALIMALIVRYQRGRLPRETDTEFATLDKPYQMGIRYTSALLRLASTLDRSRQGKIRDLRLELSSNNTWFLVVSFSKKEDITLEMYESLVEKKAFETVFNCRLGLGF